MEHSKKLKFKKKRITGEYVRRKREMDKRNKVDQELECLNQNNMHGNKVKYVTVKDGKEYDYTNPITKDAKEFYLYGDIDFLRRSNEIKELMKKPSSEVYGICVDENEIRFCDVDRYDKKFDLIQITKKHYHNACDKKEYEESHPKDSVKAQSVISDYFGKAYDFGYESFDDYLDYRYHFSINTYLEEDPNLTPLECGLDGCIFKCAEPAQLKAHQELHGKTLPFPCRDPKCKHQCNTRNELKNHMLQHCKHIFPCLFEDCHYISTIPMCDNSHYDRHRNTMYKVSIQRKSRDLCNICRKLVRNYSCHIKNHPEFCFTCRYPDCGKLYTQRHKFESHRIMHYLKDLNKKHE